MRGKAHVVGIKMIIFDVDGVLTGGQLLFGGEGELMKQFHVHDGMGITAAQQAGLKTAIITCRKSLMVEKRCCELAISEVYQGASSKQQAFKELLDKYDLAPQEAAYVGDDLNDLPVLLQVGLACAPANAVPEVKACAHFVTAKEGGNGAVREIVEYILKEQGKWDGIVDSYKKDAKIRIQQ